MHFNLSFNRDAAGNRLDKRDGAGYGKLYSYGEHNRLTQVIDRDVSGATVADGLQFVELTDPPTPLWTIATYFIHTDHLGTPRVVTDAAQATVWKWDSTPFGDSAPNEDPDGDGNSFTLNLRSPGQYYDAESGLHYNYFRTYDPATGRYVESDPIGIPGGTNGYLSFIEERIVNE